MRLPVAIDRFLAQMRVEHDWTPRTVDSVYRTLVKLADEHPEKRLADFDGRPGTELLREHIGRRYGRLAASTRATRISYFHSFWAWAEEEGYIDDDPARRIKRPPKRRPDVYRPSAAELDLFERACGSRELGAWALMGRRGLRASTVVAIRWRDIDLQRGRVRVEVKGGHRDWTPLGPRATATLQSVYQHTAPDPDDYVFVVEEERWIDQEHRRRAVRDPKTPATTKALWNMVRRVCKRAGIRPLGPHALRHGFATDFLRSGGDRDELKGLLGHSRIDTTEHYTDELKREELEEALRRVDASRSDATSVADDDDDAEQYLDDVVFAGMEAAGIEPASADGRPDAQASSDSEDDDPHLTPENGGHDAV